MGEARDPDPHVNTIKDEEEMYPTSNPTGVTPLNMLDDAHEIHLNVLPDNVIE